MSELNEWDSSYVIVGSAAGALIGLQFVVMTLVADRPVQRAPDAADAFATPTINHFCATLLLAVLLRAPWHGIDIPAALWGLLGLIGVLYTAIVARRMNALGTYRPAFEDWLFHTLLPFAAYALLAVSYFAVPAHTREVLFGVGAATLLLLFSSIHNAWDAVTYHVFVNLRVSSAKSHRDLET
jgi:hypothetical protein